MVQVPFNLFLLQRMKKTLFFSMGTPFVPFPSSNPAALSHQLLPSIVSAVPSAPIPPPTPPDPPPLLPSPPNLPISSLSLIPNSASSIPPLPNPSSAPAWSSLFKLKPRNAGVYCPRDIPLVFSGDALVPPRDVILAGNEQWKECLVGFFLDKPLPYSTVIYYLQKAWNLKGSVSVKSDGFLFLIKLSYEEDRKRIKQSDPVVMRKKLFIIKPWDEKIGNTCGSIRSVPVWIKISNIPLYAWSHTGINWLATRIGKMLCMDELTERLERISYAKCMVEVAPNQELVHSFSVKLLDGNEQIVWVEYFWKPEICVTCKEFGHSTLCCSKHSSSKNDSSNNENGTMRSNVEKGRTMEGLPKSSTAKQVWKKVKKGKSKFPSTSGSNERKEVEGGIKNTQIMEEEVQVLERSNDLTCVGADGTTGKSSKGNDKSSDGLLISNKFALLREEEEEGAVECDNCEVLGNGEIMPEGDNGVSKGLLQVNETAYFLCDEQLEVTNLGVENEVHVEANDCAQEHRCLQPKEVVGGIEGFNAVQLPSCNTYTEMIEKMNSAVQSELHEFELHEAITVSNKVDGGSDNRAKGSPLVWCSISETWSHPPSGLCYHMRGNVFSKWISNVESDEREIYYWLVNDELVICNEGEFGAINEAIIAAKDWDRRFIFSTHSPGYHPDILSSFRLCAGI